MSDLPPSSPPPRSASFRPRTFFLGLVAGLVACAGLGRLESRSDYHPGFTRFFNVISPEGQYFPTVEEMRAIVRARCRPDQVLVVVGGNSIFNGVGQPADKLWTVELQRQLGDGFAVVNLAFRGAMCTDGGAVVAESLRREYPRQIYVANAAPFTVAIPYGIEPYRYLIWEARTRGLLEKSAARDALFAWYFQHEMLWGDRVELAAREQLDRALRFRDLWNWVGYNYVFTIQNPLTPGLKPGLRPRRDYLDVEPDYEDMAFEDRLAHANNAVEMEITRSFSGHFYAKGAAGIWQPVPLLQAEFERIARGAFPDDLKARTLIMLSRNSSYYIRQLTPDELLREDAAYRDGVAEWRKLGYASAEYGRDFDPSDFGDRAHLTATGGRKLAAIVAQQVQEMSRRLGYAAALSP
jgi:lysophospholipase L1-like esterase